MNGRKKLIVVMVFTGLWFVVVLMRLRFSGPATQTSLDPSWWLALIAMFKQGAISGRDFQFTYGPLGQAVAGLATWATTSHLAFDSLHMSFLAVCWLAAIVTSVSILLAQGITSGKAAFIYISLGALNNLLEPGSFRLALLILCCVMVHRCVKQTSSRHQLRWAVATGLACFTAQLATPEVGIYGFATAMCVMGLQAYRTRSVADTMKRAFAIAGTFVVANFILSVAFALSSPTYESLFAYQRYALETMNGYQNGMGLPWSMDSRHTIALTAIALFTVICAVQTFRKLEFGEASLLVSLAIGSLFALRSALVRSDVGHIAYALTPMAFTFLVAGPAALGLKKRYINFTVWGVFYVVLLAAWPYTGFAAWNDLRTWVTQETPASNVWRQIRDQHAAPADLLSSSLVAEAARRPDAPLLAFPYDDFMPVLLQHPIVAPVLQNYSVGTLSLQDYYVRELKRYKEKGMEVLYAEDNLSAAPVDGVEAITRTPAVFEYLYRNFEQTTSEAPDKGLLLLRPMDMVRDSRLEKLGFRKAPANRNTGAVELPSPSSCGLIRIDLRLDYPFAKILLRPNPIVFEFRLRGALVKTSYLRPIAIGRDFTTLFTTILPGDFYSLFGDGPVLSKSWDSLRYYIPHTDRLSVNPSSVDIRGVDCLDGSRFVGDEEPVDAIRDPLIGLPDSQGHPIAGYIKIVPESMNVPKLMARLAYFSSVTELSEAISSREASIQLDSVSKDTTGLALVNPGMHDIDIELSTENAFSNTIQRAQVRLAPGHHISRFAGELLTMTPSATLLRARSDAPFAVLAVNIGSKDVQILSVRNVSPANPPTVFPQFAMYGNWATEVFLTNPSNETMNGTVQVRSSADTPMPATFGGVTASEFRYTIQPGGSFRLSP